MKNKLLIQLNKWIDNNYLGRYEVAFNSNSTIKKNNPAGKKLSQLTKTKLEEISLLKAEQSSLKILIIETDEIKFLAAFLAGVIASVDIFLGDPAWGEQEWQQVFSLITPDFIFGEPQSRERPNRFNRNNKITHNTQDVSLQTTGEKLVGQESLIMIPTGGTSGKVRFVMHSWATLSASVFGFQAYFDSQNINSFCTLPLYHVSGLMQFMRSFLTQGNLVFCPYKVIKNQEIELNKADYFISLVPTQLQFLIDSIPEWLTQFKTVLLGGAPASRSLLNRAREYNILLAITYGMTETASGIVTLKPEAFLAGNNSSGRVLPHAQITIEPEIEGSLERKIGLIKIKCDSLALGYYPHTFEREFVTDDLGYCDRDNYLYLVGRNSQKIITGGENVFSIEVEAAIWATKLVKDICVIGIEDQKWGQAVTAIYVPLELSHNLDLIKQTIKSQLAKYKQPKNWIAVERLPRNNRGKLNYQKLQAIAMNHKQSTNFL